MKERNVELGDGEKEMDFYFWWHNLNHYLQPSLHSSSTMNVTLLDRFQGGLVSCSRRIALGLLQQLHRKASCIAQNRATDPVINSETYGPTKSSLVTWSHSSFRSSHLLMLHFLKPSSDLVTLFLSVFTLILLLLELLFFFFSCTTYIQASSNRESDWLLEIFP